jgi:hypothetical protein
MQTTNREFALLVAIAAMVEALAMQIAEQSGKEPRSVLAQTRSRALDLANEIQLDPNVRASASAKAHHIIVELLNRIDDRLPNVA